MLACNRKDKMNQIRLNTWSYLVRYNYCIVSSAIVYKSNQIFEYLMQYNIFPNIDLSVTDARDNQTSLILACRYCNTKMVQLLLKHPNMTKKVINMQDVSGQTAFLAACDAGAFNIVQIMINDDRVDINIAKNNGKTALMSAIRCYQTQIALLLINNCKVDLKVKDEAGRSALDMAQLRKHSKGGILSPVINAIEQRFNQANMNN